MLQSLQKTNQWQRSVSKQSLYCTALAFSCIFVSSQVFALAIKTCADLQNINTNLAGDYVLANDIDCTNVYFSPIGTASTPFKGSLNGEGHSIKQLSIQKSNMTDVGLFGVTNAAIIKNFVLENVNVVGNAYLGALIGEAQNGTTIIGISATGTVRSEPGGNNMGGLIGLLDSKSVLSNSVSAITVSTLGETDTMGGLVGWLRDSSITTSHVTGTVNGFYNTGGFLGFMSSGSVTDSYSTGDVNIAVNDNYNDNIGGFIGYIKRNSGSAFVARCYATGNVNKTGWKGVHSAGGLIGTVYGGPTIANTFATGSVNGSTDIGGLIGQSFAISLSNSYSTGAVKGGASTGGLVGYTSQTKDVVNSYWDTETSGLFISSGGTGKTTLEMYQKNTYFNWDFVNTWKINEGLSYPWLG